MRRRARLAVLFALVVLLVMTGTVGAQDRTPQPYDPNEFQPWMRQLFRAEAIFVGSFPFTLFFTLEAYDSWRFASNGFTPGYAPWPFGTGTAVSYSGEETLWIALSAVSLSIVAAGIDFLIEQANGSSSSRP